MKIIFLDIDGVLNSRDWYMRREDRSKDPGLKERDFSYEFDPEAIDLLNYIEDKTHAKVVVSSTWRLGRRVEDLQKILDDAGFYGEIIDKTPSMHCRIDGQPAGYRIPRGCEIDWWLSKNGEFQRINWSKKKQQEYLDKAIVKNYVILDDDSDMLYNQREHFVRTSNLYGLTKENADRCIEILNKSLIELYYE